MNISPLPDQIIHRVFNFVTCRAALVDDHRRIIAANQAWRNFPILGGELLDLLSDSENPIEFGEGSEPSCFLWGDAFTTSLQGVMEREINNFEMTVCPNPTEVELSFLVKVKGFEHDGKRYALILQEDISETKVVQNSNPQVQITTLLDTVKSLVSTLDLEALLTTILQKLAKLIQYNAAAIFTYDTDTINQLAYQGPPLSKRSPKILKLKHGYPEIKEILANQHSFSIQNINDTPELLVEISKFFSLELQNLVRFQSWLFLPMFVSEIQVGMMVLAYHEEAYYDQEMLEMGQLFANFAAIAIQNANLYELSQHTSILKERNRLAVDLHDSIAQSLYSINLYANATQRALQLNKGEIATGHLTELQRLSGDAVREMRLMIFELNNQLLDGFGIVKALQARFLAIEAKQGIHTDLKAEGELILPKQIECEIYGILQELLNYFEQVIHTKKISIAITTGKAQISFRIDIDMILGLKTKLENTTEEISNRLRSRIHKRHGSIKFEYPEGNVMVIKLAFML